MSTESLDWLEDYSYDTLVEIARFNGLDIAANQGKKMRKRELLPHLAVNLFTRQRVEASLARLSDTEREVLDQLLLRNGEYPTVSFAQELAAEGIVLDDYDEKRTTRYYRESYVGSYRGPDSNYAIDVIARLTRHGLVFSRGGDNVYGYSYKLSFNPGDTLFVPQEIRRFLPQPEEPSLEVAEGEQGETHLADAEAFQRDLFIYWNHLRQQPAKLIKAGTVSKRSLRQINEQLLVPEETLERAGSEEDTGRLFFLRVVLEGLELARREGGWLKALGGEASPPAFWRWTLAERINACLEAWRDGKSWDELPFQSDTAPGANLQAGRLALLDLLSRQTAGRWLSAPRFRVRLAAFDTDFLFHGKARFTSQRQHGVYYAGRYYYGPARLRQLFDEDETTFVKNVLRGPLHWLGLVDIGLQERGIVSFRITPPGAHVLQGAEEPPQPEGARLLIQPNFQILTMGPVADATLARLELFAERTQTSPAAIEYTLSRDSVYRAQQLDIEIEEIIAFLEEVADTDLPQNVRRSLEEWGELHERIVFRGGVTLCQTASPELLGDLLADESLAGLLRRLSPTVAQVRRGTASNLLTALSERELLPATSGERPERDEGALTIDEEGKITFAHQVPSFHLEGRVRRLAEADGRPRGYSLTPASIQKAMRLGLEVPQVVAELEALQKAPLAPLLVRRIKAWGSYYGKASLSSPVLLQLKDRNTLRELLEDPQVGPLIRSFAPRHREALAEVGRADLDELRRLLAERGVELDERRLQE